MTVTVAERQAKDARWLLDVWRRTPLALAELPLPLISHRVTAEGSGPFDHD